MANRKASLLGNLLRVALAATLLTVIFWRVDIRDVWQGMRQVGWLPFLCAIFLFLAVRGVTAIQLHEGIKALRLQIPLSSVLRVQLISSFYSLALPGDLAGGGITWYRLFRESGRAYEVGLLIGFYRLLNTFILVALGAAASVFDQHFAHALLRTVIFVWLILIALLMLPFFSRRAASAVRRLFRPLLNRLPDWIVEKLNKAEFAARLFAGTHTGYSVAFAVLLSLAHHLIGIGWMFGLARALELDVSIFVIGWIRTLLALAQMIPVTVAGLGVREVGLIYLLGAYDAPQALALAYSLSVFAVNLVGALVGGLPEAWSPPSAAERRHG